MKKYILLVVGLLLYTTVNAQFAGQMRNRSAVPQANAGQPRLPKFNAEKSVGLVIFDIDKTIKKIGLKESSNNFKKAVTFLNTYNKEIRQVARINSFTFNEAKKKIEFIQKKAQDSGDFSIVQPIYKEVGKSFEPILKVIEEKEKALDEKLKPVLSAKQFKKWKKFQTKMKKKK